MPCCDTFDLNQNHSSFCDLAFGTLHLVPGTTDVFPHVAFETQLKETVQQKQIYSKEMALLIFN